MSLPAPSPDRDPRGSLPDNVRELRPRPRFAEWPMTIVCVVVLSSLAIAATDHFRRGAVLFSFAIVLAFFLRLLLPERDAGMLAVRSKKVDLVVMGLLALGVAVLAITVPPPS